MQQFDMQGNKHGSRSTVFNFEARPLNAKLLTRKCLVLRLLEVSAGAVREAAAQNLGGVLILLPVHPTEEERSFLLNVERDLLADELPMAVYLAYESAELLAMHAEIVRSNHADSAASAAAALLGAVWSTGFQLYTAAPAAVPLTEREVFNIHGRLTGAGFEEALPTVVLTAHYDAFGLAPGLARGANSNAAGVAVLLELARLLSRMYASARTQAKYNLVFLLSGAGKFNYQGTKRWIDEQLDGGGVAGSASSENGGLLADVSLVVCLDGLGGGAEQPLFAHVSKPPRNGSAGAQFLAHLGAAAAALGGGAPRRVQLAHKKINLAEELLAWEHERFSIRRLPALTLSHAASHQEPLRRSILDASADLPVVASNARLLGEAVTRHLFNVSTDAAFPLLGDQWLHEDTMGANLRALTAEPRPAQLLTRNHPVVLALEAAMRQVLKDVKVTGVRPDKRDPELLLYDGLEAVMSAHKVKPAVFDLFLACAIGAYLGGVYLLVLHFHHVSAVVASAMALRKRKVY